MLMIVLLMRQLLLVLHVCCDDLIDFLLPK